MGDIFDVRTDFYRKLYASFIHGKRINSVSITAALAFVHLILIADDFGNFPASIEYIREEALSRRKSQYPPEVLAIVFDELCNPPSGGNLIGRYEVEERAFFHLFEFCSRQPPINRNGRRTRRFPASPWDAAELSSAHQPAVEGDGASGCIQIDPDVSGLKHDAPILRSTIKSTSTSTGVNAAADLEEDCRKRGMDPKTIAYAITSHTPQEITAALRSVDAKREKETLRNPSGVFRTFLKNGCTPPQSRVTKGYPISDKPKSPMESPPERAAYTPTQEVIAAAAAFKVANEAKKKGILKGALK